MSAPAPADAAPADAAPAAKRQRVAGDDAAPPDMAAKPVLFSYWRSSCSYRVRIALALKKIDYEYRAVHLLKEGGQQLKDEFARDVNPMREVPCLVIDGASITQSHGAWSRRGGRGALRGGRRLRWGVCRPGCVAVGAPAAKGYSHPPPTHTPTRPRPAAAIVEYLEETRPAPPLLPSDPLLRARVREVVCAVSNDIQPVQNLRVLNRVAELAAPGGDAGAKGPIKAEWSRHFIAAGFRGLEALLARPGYAGAFCVGDAPTLADCFLVPQVYNALRFKVDLGEFPTIKRVYEALLALPEVQAAQPSAQPDAEAE